MSSLPDLTLGGTDAGAPPRDPAAATRPSREASRAPAGEPPEEVREPDPGGPDDMVPGYRGRSPESGPADEETSDLGGPAGSSDHLAEAGLAGSGMSGLERAALVAGHVVRETTARFQQVVSYPGGLSFVAPETWSEYKAYVKRRGWLPEGQRGGPLEIVPLVYYVTVGPIGFAADGLAFALIQLGRVFKRMLRFVIALTLILLVLVLWQFN